MRERWKPHCEPLYLDMFPDFVVVEEMDVDSVLVVSGSNLCKYTQYPACLQARTPMVSDQGDQEGEKDST